MEISKLVLKHDVDTFSFINEIDKSKSNKITKEELTTGLGILFNGEAKPETINEIYPAFKLEDETMDAEKFTAEVFQGSLALTIGIVKTSIEGKSREYARDAREGKLEETKGLNLDNEFSKLD